VRTVLAADGLHVYMPGDPLPVIISEPDPDEALTQQFEAERQAKLNAEFEAFKARAGQPSYKAAAVKIAAEKLGLLDAIDAAIMAEVEKAADKALLVWWRETDAISRGDAQWQQIEAAVQWGKGATAADLFALAARV
jgi:hypothetical protein